MDEALIHYDIVYFTTVWQAQLLEMAGKNVMPLLLYLEDFIEQAGRISGILLLLGIQYKTSRLTPGRVGSDCSRVPKLRERW